MLKPALNPTNNKAKNNKIMPDIFSATIIPWACSLALIACSSHTTSNSSTGKNYADNATHHTNTFATDSTIVQKEELTKIYSQSIAEYIKAVKKEYKISFDTLFFGKHVYGQPDDFPDIELPKTIENTQIRLVAPDIGLKKQKERKSLFYINMAGWVDDEKAEFVFITFSNGCEHQYDCFINYKYNAELKEFELENLRFEIYLYKKNFK